MPTIIIDGESYEVDGEKNLLETCLQLEKDLPYFCWHPAMGSVGSCRQCAVKQYQDEDDQHGRIVMSCMTPITDGMIISLEDEATKTFRDNCIEAVMANHPHDCPVCEEGGECHLQDMTNLSGHTQRTYQGLKRTHKNQDLGPFINHEMNRCIACYRCVRYYEDYAGGGDLRALSSSRNVYFGRFKDGPLENEFSGNLVEVCPTGVFTDRTFSKHFTRKWDLQSAPSICVHCAVGCNTSPGEREGSIRRIVNRYNGEVNGYFLCDRGRFGYDFTNDQNRLTDPLVQNSAIDKEAALNQFVELSKGKKVLGIGSPRASLEANFALQQMVGEKNFYSGLATEEEQLNQVVLSILENTGAKIPSLRQVENSDAVLVLGEDILNTAPRLALAVRQATKNLAYELAAGARIPPWLALPVKNIAQDARSPLFMLTPAATGIDSIAEKCHHDTPKNIARIGLAIANAIDSSAPAVADLSPEEKTLSDAIAESLKAASQPLVVSGTGCFDINVLEAAANISKALAASNDKTGLNLVVPEANSLGLAMLTQGKQDADLSAAIKRALGGDKVALVVLENDLYRRAEGAIIDSFFDAADSVIVIDSLQNDTTAKAQLVLPAGTFAESEGTLVSNEGRAQRYFTVFPVEHGIRPSWKWLLDLNADVDWQHMDELTGACAKANQKLAGITEAAPDREFRLMGQKIARQPHRYSGRHTLKAHITVDEKQIVQDEESALSFSMDARQSKLPPSLQPNIWSPGWNSNEAVNKVQEEIGGHLKGGDPGIRLLDAAGESKDSQWFTDVPQKWAPAGGSFQAVPLYHIFGSEELSALSWSINERSPKPYAALHPSDAETLQVDEQSNVSVQLGDSKWIVAVKVDSSLPKGALGLPSGLPKLKGLQGAAYGQTASVQKSKSTVIGSDKATGGDK